MKKLFYTVASLILFPSIVLAEPCAMNSSCSYKINPSTNRTIVSENITPGTYYCYVQSDKPDGEVKRLTIQNIVPSSGITVTNSKDLSANPFLTIKATTKGTVSYQIYNNWFLPVQVSYICH